MFSSGSRRTSPVEGVAPGGGRGLGPSSDWPPHRPCPWVHCRHPLLRHAGVGWGGVGWGVLVGGWQAGVSG